MVPTIAHRVLLDNREISGIGAAIDAFSLDFDDPSERFAGTAVSATSLEIDHHRIRIVFAPSIDQKSIIIIDINNLIDSFEAIGAGRRAHRRSEHAQSVVRSDRSATKFENALPDLNLQRSRFNPGSR